ncbi:hypothetical protein EJB05_49424 [Eragrostis curvula]|uniref:Uncharacterized protein n=1 Tax=Eragrostis curvula TaxID=38414 RepID=A0A5J9T4A0_9POAL|nr:hypothetical protein EJB05_49367 [Eragrostis curvula]TVU06223.1 hypothetical protein EJB05_49424 [Eragrostis curvula]
MGSSTSTLNRPAAASAFFQHYAARQTRALPSSPAASYLLTYRVHLNGDAHQVFADRSGEAIAVPVQWSES